MRPQTVRSAMTKNPITIEADATIRSALDTLETARIRHLPVTEDGKLVGIVSERDARAWRQAWIDEGGDDEFTVHEVLGRPISTKMTRDLVTIHPDALLTDAAALLVQHRIGALLVIEEEELTGIVSYVDLLNAVEPAAPTEAAPDEEGGVVEPIDPLTGKTVADVMTAPIAVVHPETSLAEAGELLLGNRIGCLPVVDGQHLVGILTEADFVRLVVHRD